MTDINKPFTEDDLYKFHTSVKSLPKIPTRVRVGKELWCEITKNAREIMSSERERECGYKQVVRFTPVELDESLEPKAYEVDYDNWED